jgi:hypothetical protein
MFVTTVAVGVEITLVIGARVAVTGTGVCVGNGDFVGMDVDRGDADKF